MSDDLRFVGAATSGMMLTLALAFGAIYFVTSSREERQLDEALLAEADEEAREIAEARDGRLQISSRPGPSPTDVGPLTKYAVLYDGQGRVLDHTRTFGDRPPARASFDHPLGRPFDLDGPREHLRAVLVEVPRHSGHLLLLAAPRTDLDGDARRLAISSVIVFVAAMLWMAFMLTLVVRRFMRLHRAVARVARRAAEGDLGARVWAERGSPEALRLARDLDEMIARLEILVTAQQRFIASASHEIRSPLTALRAELSNAIRRGRGYEEAVERGHDLAVELSTLTDDLLQLARLGATDIRELEMVELRSMAHAVAKALEPIASARSVTVRVDGSDASVEGRPLELQSLLRNLIENSIRHTPEGTVVSVDVYAREGRARIDVDDAGEGIPESERDAVFEPFLRGRSARARNEDGTGLGLTIARTIARTHGGDISVTDSPLGGARFRVDLPLR